MNFKQLIFAREFRGLSQTELANAIQGLSQSNLSKFEKGLSTISEKVQNSIIDYLGFPEDFYNEKIYNVVENSNYRRKSVVSKSELLHFELRCRLIGYLVDVMSEELELPEFKLQPLNVDEGFSPKKIASYTRRSLGFKEDEPVKEIYSILESAGILIYEIDVIEKFDAISFISDKGFPIIVINKNFSNDRKRFTLAHELGHILMHDERNFPITDFKSDKDIEAEANQFAGEFLMPESSIRNSLHGLTLKDLVPLKSYWLTSMGAIIRRALDLNCINKDRSTYFNIEMSRLGYRKNEPCPVYIDKPKLFIEAYNIFKEELNYTDVELSKSFKLPLDIVNEIFEIKPKKGLIRVLNHI